MNETGHRLSRRTAWDLDQSSFSAGIERERASGRELIDLTISNPTRCGFDYEEEAILGPFRTGETMRGALIYDPDPRGMRSAREAVAGYYADHGAAIDPNSVMLTTSTSEAYSYLFRLLCDAGDEVLVAQPSYPLFEFLADLDDVRLVPYSLFYDFGWWIDFAELESRIGPRTRAIVVVHPNNPTGHWTHAAERAKLEELCERHRLALIVDEVFLDYPMSDDAPDQGRSFTTGEYRALTFVLSGISKIAALPQMKVAWVVSCGPQAAVAEALLRLEMIADTFLSINAPAQLALPAWLASRKHIQRQIVDRIGANLRGLKSSGLEMLHVEAGWSAILRFTLEPRFRKASDGHAAAILLERCGVIVHPGDFYGLTDVRTVIVSLITPESAFRSGVESVYALCNRYS